MKTSRSVEPVDVTPVQAAFIHRRVGVLVRQDRAIIDLMGDAYVQGLSDAVNLPQLKEAAHG